MDEKRNKLTVEACQACINIYQDIEQFNVDTPGMELYIEAWKSGRALVQWNMEKSHGNEKKERSEIQ